MQKQGLYQVQSSFIVPTEYTAGIEMKQGESISARSAAAYFAIATLYVIEL